MVDNAVPPPPWYICPFIIIIKYFYKLAVRKEACSTSPHTKLQLVYSLPHHSPCFLQKSSCSVVYKLDRTGNYIICCCCEVPQGGRDQGMGGRGDYCLNSILVTTQKGGGGTGRGDSHLAKGLLH